MQILGWENVGVYRAVIHDKNTTSMSVAQGSAHLVPLEKLA